MTYPRPCLVRFMLRYKTYLHVRSTYVGPKTAPKMNSYLGPYLSKKLSMLHVTIPRFFEMYCMNLESLDVERTFVH